MINFINLIIPNIINDINNTKIKFLMTKSLNIINNIDIITINIYLIISIIDLSLYAIKSNIFLINKDIENKINAILEVILIVTTI